MRSGIAARVAAGLGYTNVWRYPAGYKGWLEYTGLDNQTPGPKLLLPGDVFPETRLTVLKADTDRPYLGLPEGATGFHLSETKPEFLLVEVYSEMCTFCMEQMTVYGQVARALESEPGLAGRVKMIGLGMGQTDRAAAGMRKEPGAPYPLFADKGQHVFKALGSPLLPALYLLRKDKDGLRIVLFEPGHEDGLEETLDWVRSGLDPDLK